MAVHGRHRRYQPNRINRASLTVTAGGAGLALPLIGAGSVHAADAATWNKVAARESSGDWSVNTGNGYHGGLQFTRSTWAAYDGTASALLPGSGEAVHISDVQPQMAPQSRAGKAEMYTVVRGDTLSGIAEERDVRGGWQRLYAANRTTVGADPDLILPGQRLTLHTAHAAAPPAEKSAKPSKKTEKAEKAEKAEKTERTEKAAKAAKAHRESEKPAKPTRRGHTSLTAPVNARTGTPYRAVGSYWSKGYHTGVDFPVPTGTSVHAVAAGRVVDAGWGGSYGYQVVIRHADGRYSQYAHLSAISVRTGQEVSVGRRIGRSGATGNATGPHLHFEVRTGPAFGADIDPVAYLRAGGVRI
ncbi:peptidoglycan DD-metalloendopeptidase family protein [Streptomyces sp. V3I7]|uniref:peptidoglycan DD-metalloendopeptidase family protein n=1 Tax=Streptomyces sp. V3I7 TaxID=3042278 RepID=UPI002784E7BC|nr:peptidoglycan DD-metalloendopeptidase family protein [Streptomyces sp. V3I7]MDQ0994283.1 murein DD-endopeptidase MepM/ murein hydrolase activator NlpD [Streptomyces sp. V3I7]